MRLRVATRLLDIQRVLVRHGLDEFILATHLFRPLRFAFYLSPATWFERKKGGPRAERIRLALEELGPIFVKFGQALSTRRDLLPPDIADELAKLQDRVPPFPSADAKSIIARAYGQPAEEVFERFDDAPLAAASIAQVHTARLRSGEEVVVKVVRPHVRERIERDLEVMYELAQLARDYSKEGHRLRPLEVVAEYERTIIDELDLMREAANAAQLKRNFTGSHLLYVPQVHWDYCRPEVMVMERIHGVLVNDMDELRRRNVNIRVLAENGVEIFFTQVFRHNFFHADMHPGNIFVQVQDPERPVYAAVDFGIVGTLDARDQHYLAENFLAFFDRDYNRVARLHVDSGWVPAETRVDELEGAVRTVCEPIFNKPLEEISFATVLMRLFEIARRFDMRIQPQLLLLQKTMLQIEGLGRQLYPQLDLWQTARPILQDWASERFSGRSFAEQFRRQLPDINEAVRALPQVLQQFIQKAGEGTLRIRMDQTPYEELRREIRESARRRDQTIIGAAVLLAGIVWLALRVDWLPGLALTAAGLLTVLLARR
ncbi:MAG TPA: ubiquinone biosynthesis regulatory protein kinase UbiB [Steroidobacteraceae bacterium]|jgi:ubiquinone biosynthesis protein|nr:ubiquinone biosynthesis regulatory protein kinase UbiB [Steroidobacteraceae bacterium]